VNLRPSLEEVLAHAGDETHIALTLELSTDTETPISIYHKLSQDRPAAFLLESVEGGETLGRYSFIGFEIVRWLSFPPDGERDPLLDVKRELARYRVAARPDLPRFQGGAVGYLGYDAVRHFEKVPLPPTSGGGPARPESLFLLTEDLAIFDHLFGKLILLTHVPLAGDRRAQYQAHAARLSELVDRLRRPPPPPRPLTLSAPPPASFSESPTSEIFRRAVETAKEAIRAGEIFQVVLSRRITVEADVAPFALYRALRGLNPSPYMFYLRFDGWAVVGASPEVLVRLEGDEILLRPIAGTRRREKDRHKDLELGQELLSDPKELAEHRMLLDLGRNDVGRVARIGSVEVDRPLHIERYSHVMHLVSDVRGRLGPGQDAFSVFRACFPAGTVSGAPKIRAMELIAALEPERRGIYAGAVGYFDFAGNMDTCIAIRTMVVEPGRVHLRAGAGIVLDSDPEREDAECLSKARSGLLAIARAREESAS
jgi:anthranilate synthase component 1